MNSTPEEDVHENNNCSDRCPNNRYNVTLLYYMKFITQIFFQLYQITEHTLILLLLMITIVYDVIAYYILNSSRRNKIIWISLVIGILIMAIGFHIYKGREHSHKKEKKNEVIKSEPVNEKAPTPLSQQSLVNKCSSFFCKFKDCKECGDHGPCYKFCESKRSKKHHLSDIRIK